MGSLRSNCRLFIQFGGKGNAGEVLEVVNKKMSEAKWNKYFENFTFQYRFFGPEEYNNWLDQAGFRASRVELIPKDMVQSGVKGLESWVGSTWLPYIESVPDEMQGDFIREIVEDFVLAHPLDNDEQVHVKMVRLEVESEKA